MNQKTQLQFVRDELLTQGEITRNFCLRNYITRLSGIIFNLKREGFEFFTFTQDTIKPDGTSGKDFIYKVTKYPDPFKELENNG